MQEVRGININNMLVGTSHIMIREASFPNVRSKRLREVGKNRVHIRGSDHNLHVFELVQGSYAVPNELFYYQKIVTIFSLSCTFICISGMTRYLPYVTYKLKNILTYRKWIFDMMSIYCTYTSVFLWRLNFLCVTWTNTSNQFEFPCPPYPTPLLRNTLGINWDLTRNWRGNRSAVGENTS